MLYHFDNADARRFLDLRVYFAGAKYGSVDCQLARFIEQGIWTNGWIDCGEPEVEITNGVATVVKNRNVNRYAQRTAELDKGHLILIKRLNGFVAKGCDASMRLMAAGVVVGRKDAGTLRVAWVLPTLDEEVPLVEVGTISGGQTFDNLSSRVQIIVEKVRSKFLRLNLNIQDRYYS